MIRRNRGAAVSSSLFIVGKCVYVFALFLASDYLHNNYRSSLLSFTFLLMFLSSIIFLTLQKSWPLARDILLGRTWTTQTGAKRETLISGNEKGQATSQSKQILVLFVNGITMMATFTLFHLGLKNCGPIRAILMEFADSFLLAIPSLLCGFASIPSTRRRGLILVTLAVLLLLFSQEPGAHDAASALAISQAQVEPGAEPLEASITAPPHSTRVLGVIDLSEGAVGMCALLLSAAIGSLRRTYEKSESRDFGGRKRLHAVSMFVGSIALLPTLGLMYFFDSGVDEVGATIASSATAAAAAAAGGIEELSLLTSTITILFLVIFYVVVQFYVEAFASRAANDSQLLIKLNLLVSFLFAALLDMWRGEERLNVPIVGAATILFFGVHFLVQSARGSGGVGSPSGVNGGGLMPLYAAAPVKPPSTGHGLTGLSVRELKMMFKHFMSDKTSMRIFMFLTINFLFMFVELIYGWYSNSLGLISDAGHMLFDCTALAIGLYASFVSKLKPNQLYTYGYGRYEIISGYTNAVFLLFIGYFIFVESVERLFKPPEITSDSLVLVSVLGLMVNMVGLFFFHDHGSHGHSHSGPGGGHGHSHGSPPAASSSHADHGHSHGSGACSHNHDSTPANSKAAAAEAAQHNSNMFAIYLHILADALGSVGVIISSLLVKYKGWMMADAICSIIISVLIIASVLPLIRSTLETLNQRIPTYKEPAIRDTLRRLTDDVDGVIAYREAHFWTFSDTDTIGTLHIHVRDDVDEQRMLQQVTDLFKESGVAITNLSIQIEKERFIATIENELKVRPFLTQGHL